jgi:uncharacterized protein (TIGR02145 family)
MKSKHLPAASIILFSMLFFSCEREYDNPWDEKSSLDPNAWAPQNLQITDVSFTEKKLTWTYGEENIEGFKIDRKEGSGEWQVAYATCGKEIRNWTDNLIIPDPSLTYSYRVKAFAGNYYSSYIEKSKTAAFQAPANLLITTNSLTSVTLTWQDNSNGEEGFKIDRKENNGSWITSYATLNANQETFSENVSDLSSNTYTYRVYAFLGPYESQKAEAMTLLPCGYPFTDSRDGNPYETVEIGTQCWMKQNLAYLPSVNPPSGGSQTSPYYYVYGYSGTGVSEARATANYQTYGVLYNWTASLTACPQGWHLPSDSEWDVLVNYLGGDNVAGGKMKEAGTAHWNSPNTGATNESGFTGLPGGGRYYYGSFNYIGYYGTWWSSTETSSTIAWLRLLSYGYGNVYLDGNDEEYGFSVRCLRD